MALPAAWGPLLRLPVIVAPMFLVSGPELVVAAVNAGMIGTFPSLNCRSATELDIWLDRVEQQRRPDAPPYAVNLVVHRSNARLDADLQIVVARPFRS